MLVVLFTLFPTMTLTVVHTDLLSTLVPTAAMILLRAAMVQGCFQEQHVRQSPLELDADGRIQPYVDFTDFFKTIESLTNEEREMYEAQTELKPAYEPIMEEPATPDSPLDEKIETEMVNQREFSDSKERESNV